MSFMNLPRDDERIKKTFAYTEDNQLVTKTGCRIYVPVRYTECRLADVGEDIWSIAIFAYTVDDACYAVSSAIAPMTLQPTSYRTMEIEGEDYFEFTFQKGATITKSAQLIKDDINVYLVIDEYYFKGNIPSFMSYMDVGKLFVTAVEHAGMLLSPDNVPPEMIVSVLAREIDDHTKFHRHSADPCGVGNSKRKQMWIGLRNALLSAHGTLASIAGSHMNQGIVSALNNPSQRVEKYEELLRK